MRQHKACTAYLRRIDNDVAHRKDDRFRFSFIALYVETARGGVDMGHPQPLPAITPWWEASSKEAPRSFLAVDDRGSFDALG